MIEDVHSLINWKIVMMYLETMCACKYISGGKKVNPKQAKKYWEFRLLDLRYKRYIILLKKKNWDCFFRWYVISSISWWLTGSIHENYFKIIKGYFDWYINQG